MLLRQQALATVQQCAFVDEMKLYQANVRITEAELALEGSKVKV